MFIAATAFGALGEGYPPTMHSLALELYTRRGGAPSEAGRLFGAMSVIQTIGCALLYNHRKVCHDVDRMLYRNQVVGPSLFGAVYIKTVSMFPEMIFYVVVAVVSVSLFFLSLARVPPYPGAIDPEVEGPTAAGVPTAVMNDE